MIQLVFRGTNLENILLFNVLHSTHKKQHKQQHTLKKKKKKSIPRLKGSTIQINQLNKTHTFVPFKLPKIR